MKAVMSDLDLAAQAKAIAAEMHKYARPPMTLCQQATALLEAMAERLEQLVDDTKDRR